MNRARTQSLKKILLTGLPATLILLLAASFYWLLYTTSGGVWVWKQVEDTAAGALQYSQVDGDLASGFVIRDIEYQSDAVDVSIRRADIEVRPGWWPVSVQVNILTVQDVEIVTHVPGQAVQGTDEEIDIRSALEALKLPVPLKLHDVALTNIRLKEGEEAPGVLIESLKFQAELDEQLLVDQLDMFAAGIEVRAHGNLALESPFELAIQVEGRFERAAETGAVDLKFPFKLDGSGNLENVQFNLTSLENGLDLGGEQLQLEVSGSGTVSGIQIGHAALTGPGVDMGINGKLDWSTKPEARLGVILKQLDFSPWLQSWPAGKHMTGDFQLNWSAAGLVIQPSRLTVDETDLVVDIEADFNTETNSVNARLDWSGFSWPLANTNPDFSSPSGQLNLSGSFNQWTSDGQVEIQLGDYPQGRFGIRGSGDRTSARLAILDGDVLGGSVSGEANVDWAGGFDWGASIRTQDVDPESLFSGWPGRLDAEIELDAQSQPEKIQIKLISMQGMLRGVPLSARGGLSIEDDTLTLSSVELRTDEAVLKLNGAMAEPAGITVKFSGYLPSVLLEGASGSLELEGRYSSNVVRPLLDVQLEGLDLAWQDVQLDELSLSFKPTGEQHSLQASVVTEAILLSTAMTLAPGSRDGLFGSAWRGVLDDLEMVVNESYSFDMLKPAPIEWSSDSVALGPMCLHEKSGAGLCLNGDYQSSGDWSLIADVTAVSFDYLRDILKLNLHFEQNLEGHLEWHQPHDQAPTGGAEFNFTAGRILELPGNEVLAETNEGRFAFVLRNGNLESGVLDIEIPGTGFIDVDFDVLDIRGDGTGTLQGRAVAQLESIKLLGQLAWPGLDNINGLFDSNIQLGGTLANPVFDGGFKLSDGFIQYAPIGLKLEDIEFGGQVVSRDRASFKGQFRAGEGIGSIDGRFLFGDIENLQMDIAFTGEQLLLINTDALKMNTETDLKLSLNQQRRDINGFIRIPSARLTPSNLLLREVNDSSDLVIETRGDELQSGADATASKTPVYGQLELTFGDDVLIHVPDIETNISGSVLFNWSGDPVPLAQGSYQLQGKVDVYGPTLQVENGHISFPGVPANNPLLNIRAEREIFGNTQIRSAGVQVIGTFKRPVLEAYTVPVTNEDRAWTLLVTGTDFDQGQGVGGFDVGTYIAPKLYVSYGISLFEDENVVSARYDLKKGFGIKVTSGQRESGLDVSYTIDK